MSSAESTDILETTRYHLQAVWKLLSYQQCIIFFKEKKRSEARGENMQLDAGEPFREFIISRSDCFSGREVKELYILSTEF